MTDSSYQSMVRSFHGATAKQIIWRRLQKPAGPSSSHVHERVPYQWINIVPTMPSRNPDTAPIAGKSWCFRCARGAMSSKIT